jgi:hypothetical protein
MRPAGFLAGATVQARDKDESAEDDARVDFFKDSSGRADPVERHRMDSWDHAGKPATPAARPAWTSTSTNSARFDARIIARPA